MPGPSFICPGAQKSGTTWLHRMLRAHPGFWMPPQKEMDYLAEYPKSREKYARRFAEGKTMPNRAKWWKAFTADWDLARYPSLFEKAGDKLSADVSPNYSLMTRDDILRAAQVVPDARVVLLLRDPVSRAWSHARHTISRGKQANLPPDEQRAAMARFALSERCARFTDYPRMVSDWCAGFGQDRVGVFWYETLREDPAAFIGGILEFAGAAPFPEKKAHLLTEVENRGVSVACPDDTKEQLRTAFAPMMDQLRDMVPEDCRPPWLAD